MAIDAPVVLVLGDVRLEEQILSTQNGTGVAVQQSRQQQLGWGGRVAVNLATMGCTAYLLGLTGDDAAGTALASCCAAAGVYAKFLPGLQATQTQLQVRQDGRVRASVVTTTTLNGPVGPALYHSVVELLPQLRLLVLADYGAGTLEPALAEALLQAAAARRTPVYVRMPIAHQGWYGGAALCQVALADVLAYAEAKGLVHPAAVADLPQVLYWAANAVTVPGADRVVADGCHTVCYQAGGVWLSSVAPDGLVETAGVDETLLAGYAAAAAFGQCGSARTAWAAAAAGLAATAKDGAPIAGSQVDDAVCQRGGPVAKVLLITDALRQARSWQAQKQRVALVAGAFDELHVGHVTLLQAARQHADRLLVCLRDDTALAGRTPSALTEAERQRHVAELSCVDRVAAFDGDLLKLVHCWRPDVYAQGEDALLAGPVPAADYLVRSGVQVLTLPMFPPVDP